MYVYMYIYLPPTHIYSPSLVFTLCHTNAHFSLSLPLSISLSLSLSISLFLYTYMI